MLIIPPLQKSVLVPGAAAAAYHTGNRTWKGATATSSVGLFSSGSASTLVTGQLTQTAFFVNGLSASAHWIKFDLGSSKVVNAATWYQDTINTHGTWKWQGSNDDSSYTDVGSSFTLGAAAQQEHTSLNGNVTAYRYWRLQGVSGTTSSTPWLEGIELNGPSWIRVTSSGSSTLFRGSSGVGTGPLELNLVDGSQTNDDNNAAGFRSVGTLAVSGNWIKFDLGAAVTVVEAKWYQSSAEDDKTWKWQGSNDDSSYSDIGGSFNLGALATDTHTSLNGNVTAYRYYQIIGVSGSMDTTLTSRQLEVEFKY